jgi:fumarate hydratase subunit beta
MGPIVRQLPDSSYQIVSGGPTTSERMAPYQAEVCKTLGVQIVIGKGGMKSVKWSEIPAVYLQFPGGAGAIATKFIEKVEGVVWLDLGPPEAVWFLKVKNFGPCIVAMDAKGNSLFK